MAFIAFDFYIFLAVLAVLYYLLPIKARWLVLLTGSLGFYWVISGSAKIGFIVLIGASFVCWISGKLMGKEKKYRKIVLFAAILVTAMPLLAVKGAALFGGMDVSLPEWWVAPVGIAFFSLQLIAYAADVYMGKITPESNYLKFLLFTSFFPQILQGPIPRYGQLSHQLVNGNRFTEKNITEGFMLIVWGFFLKLCIADKAGIIVNQVFDHYPTYSGAYVLLAGILYSFQLYTDFLACTTLAQGISALFGVKLINNFEHPYFAESIKDFWRRWHISLSTWLRDYIYIPLGGNRKGKIRKYLNLLITFAVSGIWHGVGFKFMFWGLLHGVYQIIGDALCPARDRLEDKLGLNRHAHLKKGLKSLCTFILVMLAWIIFRADSLMIGLSMIRSIFTVYNPWILTNDAMFGLGLGWKECMVLLFGLVILFLVDFVQEKGISIKGKILGCSLPVRWCIYIGAIVFVLIFGTYGFGYDAQAFIYGGL